jgi:sugar O-acyltransferase (sialic acid O-acetyltransferase NeuD family)
MKKIVIYGAGGFGKEVLWLIENINASCNDYWKILGFVDDIKSEEFVGGFPILGNKSWFEQNKEKIYVACAVGDSQSRYDMYKFLEKFSNISYTYLIDPSVVMGNNLHIEDKTIICHGCNIMSDAHICEGVVINIRSAIGHDSYLSPYCTCLVHTIIAGGVKIGTLSTIGSGSFIKEGISVGDSVKVAPLSSVLKDILKSGVYSGNPARQML